MSCNPINEEKGDNSKKEMLIELMDIFPGLQKIGGDS